MSMPQKALSALVCIVVAFVLGFVARLPALMERLNTQAHSVSGIDVSLTTLPTSQASAWGGANPLR